MPLVAVGRIAGCLLVAASLVQACGGHSERVVDDGSADDGSGDDADDGGTSGGFGGSGGNIAVGGAMPAGGTSDGGTGFGGVVTTGGFGGAVGMGGASGSIGVGGASPCPECPPWDYGLIVEGDGEPVVMKFNGGIPVQAEPELPGSPPICPGQSFLGTVSGCGRSVAISACAGPENEPPCLEVAAGTARYLFRGGDIWSGIVTSDVTNPSVPGVASGTLTLELSGQGNAIMLLTVAYTFCFALSNADIVCLSP